jgi:DNA-binding transcriptional regulator YhcF (GntR family)
MCRDASPLWITMIAVTYIQQYITQRGADTSALDTAVAFLREQAQHAAALQRQRLDTHVGLARSAGVSAGTMLKAVRRLCAEGVLVSKRKSGVRLAGTPASPELSAPAGGWQAIACHLREEVVADAVTGSAQLAPKEISRRFGVCYRTARRALAELTREGLVERQGRTHCLPESHVRPGGMELVFIGPTNRFGRLEEFTPRAGGLLRLCERACSMRGMRLTVVGFDYRAERFVFVRPGRTSWAGVLHRAAGCVALTSALGSGALVELGDACSRRPVPLALVDEVGGFGPDACRQLRGPWRLFRPILDARAGRQVGAFLKRRGHKSIAYFSASHAAAWSRERLAGLNEEYARAALHRFTIDELEILDTLLVSQSEARGALAALAPVRRFLDVDAGLSDECVDEVRSSLFRAARGEILRVRMRPLFTQALSRREVSAWVGGNDEVALAAMDFLHERRIASPARISVVGFDNSPAAAARRLTSYSFNEARTVDTVMRYVLVDARRSAGRRDGSPVALVDGAVVERDSVARPPVI